MSDLATPERQVTIYTAEHLRELFNANAHDLVEDPEKLFHAAELVAARIANNPRGPIPPREQTKAAIDVGYHAVKSVPLGLPYYFTSSRKFMDYRNTIFVEVPADTDRALHFITFGLGFGIKTRRAKLQLESEQSTI